jgi:alpha/beta superfamily hydrolase
MERQVQFKNHVGETLAGTLHYTDRDPIGAVIAGHCFTCSRHTGILRRVCKELSHKGLMALRFDFSGNGQSQGIFEEATWSKQILEMEAAISMMQEKGVTWIGLAGHSLGAAIALLTTLRDKPVSAICRIAGRTTANRNQHFLTPSQIQVLEDAGEVEFISRGRTLTLSRNFFEDAARYNLETAIQSLTIPMLVVHGDRDDIIPVTEARLAKQTNPEKVKLAVVPGGDHMFSNADHQEQIARTVADWFSHQVDTA